MRHLVYFLATALIASISFTSCQRKAITQEEIDELNRQISEKLAMVENNDDTTTSITIDSASTDSTIKVNTPQNDKKTEITIIQGHNGGESVGAVLFLSIVATAPFACAVLIVFFIIRGITSRQREHNKLIEKAIECNYPLPNDFFKAPKQSKSRLQSALVWLAWGVGIIAFCLIVSEAKDTVFAIGFIPLLVGVAKLITYFVEDRKKEDAE